MSIENVREYFKAWNKENDIMEFETSSATVELAAATVGVIPARIAKTLSLKRDENAILIVVAGDAKLDNKKFKAEFGFKPKMLSFDEVNDLIGHDVGGVCPFGTKEGIDVFLDISMKRFESVFPACGSSNSAIKLTCDELEKYSNSKKWVTRLLQQI